MRICTITCNNAVNYGARLQTFALQHYLESIGHDVSVIDYSPEYMTFAVKQWYNPGLSIKEWAKLFLRFAQRRNDISKYNALERFSAKRLNLTHKYKSVDELRINPPTADLYIAGSDQIWNVNFPNGHDAAFYLDFGAPSVRRMSYAASFAIPALPQADAAEVGQLLKGIDMITVRETSAVDIVASLGEKAELVCDPVFLLSADFWGNEFAGPQNYHEGYVLVYDFERSDSLRSVAQRIAKRYGLKVYSVSPWKLGWADKNFSDCSPEKFVALFRDARFVVSNSLHGSIFSLIFHKDFFVVNRADGLNVRMADLLSMLELDSRIVSPTVDNTVIDSHIDYISVNKALDSLISSSQALLHGL